MDFTERKRRHLERREAFQRFRTLANEVSDLSKQVLACHEHDRELSERLDLNQALKKHNRRNFT